MVNICLVRWNIDGVSGGVKVAINLSNELSKYYKVHFVSMTSIVDEPFFDISSNVTYHNFKQGKYKLSKNIIMFSKLLRKYLSDHNIDIVMGIGISANILSILSTIGTDIKTVCCEHVNSSESQETRADKVQRYIGAKFSDRIITLTEGDRFKYIQKYNLSPNKVQYIYNWIENRETINPINVNDKRIVTVGRFSYQKGYDLLTKVAIKVLKKHPDWQWDIYGSGEQRFKNQLIIDIDKGRVTKQVHLKGAVKGTENIYPDHSIYVMTSYFEGLPLVLLEAKKYGLPIVSFNCPTGPDEIVRDNINGYLIEPYNVDKMVEKLSMLMDNVDLRETFSKSAYLDINKFDKESIISQWKDLIDDLASVEGDK